MDDDGEDEMYASKKKNNSSMSSNNFDGFESDVLSISSLVIGPLFIIFLK
jgi:hypothetical protein